MPPPSGPQKAPSAGTRRPWISCPRMRTARNASSCSGPLAQVLAGIGHFAQSRATLLELLELVPADATAQRVRLIAACAGVEHLMGQHTAAHTRLTSALDQLPEQRSADAAALMLELATDAFFAGPYPQMLDWGLRARATAGPLGQAPLTAAAEATICSAHAHAGRTTEAQAARTRTAAIVDQLSDDQLAQRLDAANNLVVAEINLNRFGDAVAHAERGLRVGRATGQGQLFPNLTQCKGLGTGHGGPPGGTAQVMDGAVEAARRAANPQILAWALLGRAWTALVAGDLEVALRTGEEAAELTGGLDASMLSPFATGMLAAVLVEAGEPARGLDLLIPAAGGPELPGLAPLWAAVFHGVAARAWLARRHHEAELAAARAESAAVALGLPWATAIACRARAAVAIASTASHWHERHGRVPSPAGSGRSPSWSARQDQPRDRRRALPQPQDGRDPPAPHLRQAGRLLAGGGGPRAQALKHQALAHRPATLHRSPSGGSSAVDGPPSWAAGLGTPVFTPMVPVTRSSPNCAVPQPTPSRRPRGRMH
jgi:hypothetical protein